MVAGRCETVLVAGDVTVTVGATLAFTAIIAMALVLRDPAAVGRLGSRLVRSRWGRSPRYR